MSHSESFSGEVLELAEQFLARYRKGERPPLCEYADRYPHLAEQIREVFPAMALMENIAIDESQSAGRVEAHAGAEPPLQQLGDYRIIREVGRGGMGIVYEAEQVSLGRHVALKVLPRQMLLDGKQKRRFEREAKAAARLHHTNIVPVFGVGEHEGMNYYVMQFIQGLGLDQVLTELRQMHGDNRATAVMPMASQKPASPSRGETAAAEMARSLMTGGFERTVLGPDEPIPSVEAHEGPPQVAPASPGREAGGFAPRPAPSGPGISATLTSPTSDASSGSFSGSITLPGQAGTQSSAKVKQATYWQSVAQIGVQVAGALQYAHDQGILHRDIKPSNLLLDLRGTVWIADFGLAKANDQQEITHTGDILGTLRYMPPEAFEGKGDARSDLYSLGLTLYELLALKPAFDDKDRNRLIQRVTTAEAPALETLNPAIPRDLATIVHKAIDREPGHRYASAGELAEDLRRFIDDEPIVARPLSSLERLGRWSRRNRVLAASLGTVGALVALIAIGSTLMAGYFRQSARENRRLAEQAERETARAQKQSEELQRANDELRWKGYVANMSAAAHALSEHDAIAAKRILRSYMPRKGENDLRGFEWHYLWRQCQGEGEIIAKYPGPCINLDFSADGASLNCRHLLEPFVLTDFSHAMDRQVVSTLKWPADRRPGDAPPNFVRDLSVGLLGTLGGELGAVVRLCPDDSIEIFYSASGERVKLDSATGARGGWRSSLAGNRVLRWTTPAEANAISTSDKIEVWDTRSGQLIFRRDNVPPLVGLRFHEDGREIAIGYRGPLKVEVWSIDSPEDTLVTDTESRCFALGLSSDRKWLLECKSEEVLVRDRQTGQPMKRWNASGIGPCMACFSRDGQRAAVGYIDGLVEVFPVNGAQPVSLFHGCEGVVTSLAFTPDGSGVIAGSVDGLVWYWRLPSAAGSASENESDRVPVPFPRSYGGNMLSSDGRVAIHRMVRHNDRFVMELRHVAEDRVSDLPIDDPMAITALDWKQDASLLYVTLQTGQVAIVDTNTLKIVGEFAIDTDTTPRTALSENGNVFAHTANGGSVQLRNSETGELVGSVTPPVATSRRIALNSDASRLVVGDSNRGITLWKLEPSASPTLIWQHEGPEDSIELVKFQPRTNHFYVLTSASFGAVGVCRIWKPELSESALQIVGRRGRQWCGEFSRDGGRIAIGGFDGAVRIYDTQTAAELLALKSHFGTVYSVRFHSDGKQLVSLSLRNVRGGEVTNWDASPVDE